MINKVFLLGYLGKDPDVRMTQSGKVVVSCSLSTTESYKDKDGKWQSKSEWHNLVIWDKAAETFAKHFKKGSKVAVDGKLQTRQWEDQNGNKRYTTEILVKDFYFVDSKKEKGSPTEDQENHGLPENCGEDVPF